MSTRARLTLGQVFFLTLLGLMLFLGLLLYGVFQGTRTSILQSADRLHREVGARLTGRVLGFRDQAEKVADNVETDLQKGLIHVTDQAGLQAALYEQVLNHPDIAEVTFTHADSPGVDVNGIEIGPQNHWQVSVFRSADANKKDQIIIRRVHVDAPAVTVERQQSDAVSTHTYRDPKYDPTTHPTLTYDPTTHPTFTIPTSFNEDRPFWTDLHYSEIAADESGSARIEVTVMKVVRGSDKKFLGVVRVGLLEDQLNSIVAPELAGQTSSAETGPDPIQHVCFLCDLQGRLITPVTPTDVQDTSDPDGLRIRSPNAPPEITAALSKLSTGGGEVVAAGKPYLVTFIPLSHPIQDWLLCVVAPEDQYFGKLIETRDRLLELASLVIVVILAGGALTLSAVQRGLTRLRSVASRMRQLDFAPSDEAAPFKDVQRVLDSLEQAKTAIRAMGKYVPMDLVRELYEMNREPILGGELRDLSIMFTDIAGFTSLTEMLDPDRLAKALGQYLEVMAAAIHEHSGTIDKYVGDSVMALWNAPKPCPNHGLKACAAALACTTATRTLFASESWKGLPQLTTRCGIHRDTVTVGHFGAPDRLSYTAIGDGVNLASRLEGLNKLYGTTIIVSETIQQEASAAFHFRQLDRVAVVGKRQAVRIFELRELPSDAAAAYEAALNAYWNRDFTGAIEILQKHLADDPPSAVLFDRCRQFLKSPPPLDWDGVHVSTMK